MADIDINIYADIYHSVKVCGLQPADTILDIGAGSGSFAKKYPFVHSKITSLDKADSEEGSFEICKKTYTDERFTHVVGDAKDLSQFKDNSFDMVVLLQVIEHFPEDDIDMVMCGIRRVLKSGGQFAMSTPNKPVRELVDKYMANEHHVQEFDNDELLYLYKRHGFKIVDNCGILRVEPGKVYINEIACKPEEGYLIWILATKE